MDDKLYEKARVDFHRGTTLKPDWADAYANTGALMIQRGHAERVNEEYAKAIEADFSYALAYNGRACALANLDSLEEARRCLVKADSLLPNLPYVVLNAKALAAPGDTSSPLARIAGKTVDSLHARGSWYLSDFQLGIGDTYARWTRDPYLDKWSLSRFQLGFGGTHMGFERDPYRGGVYFGGVRLSGKARPENVGTDFLLSYPRRE